MARPAEATLRRSARIFLRLGWDSAARKASKSAQPSLRQWNCTPRRCIAPRASSRAASDSVGKSTCREDSPLSAARRIKARAAASRARSSAASSRGPVTGVKGTADSSLG